MTCSYHTLIRTIDVLRLAPAIFMLILGSALIGAPPMLWAGDLHDAVRNKDIASVESILAGGADVDETDYVLGTPLHIAVLDGSEEIAKSLIHHGADVDAAGELQNNRPLHLAAEFGRASMLDLLLDNGATIDARNDIQRTPLMLAVVVGNAEAARLLLDRGADIEARESRQGDTPLILASFYGHLEIVKLLVENGADIHATDREGRASFRKAAMPPSYTRVGGPALLEYLKSKGADPNAREDSGLSVLEWAEDQDRAEQGNLVYTDIVKTVRRLGATE